jgi:DNA-binding transcriptional LysR family regulator
MHKRMDWPTARFDWNRARAFLATAEEGSLSAAARALGMTQPTLGRQVTALEEELGVALFERVGRGLTLTAGGRDLLEHVRAMGEAAGRLSRSATGRSERIDGLVTITASEVLSAFVLPPVLLRLRQIHPGVEVNLVASNAVHDLRRREADVAVRSGRPTDPELFATRLRDTPARMYASPGYLQALGRPRTMADLSRADFIGFGVDARASEVMLEGLNAMGFALTRKNFPLHTGAHLVLWELVKRGLGIGIIIEEVGDAEPGVERVLPELPPIPVPTWLVAHREVHTSRRVRVVFDLIAEMLGPRREGSPPPRPPRRRGR